MIRWVHRALSDVRARFKSRPGHDRGARVNPLSNFTRSFDS